MKNLDLDLREKLTNDPIPYRLLLLADESINVINKYIHECTIYLVRSSGNPIGVCAVHELETSTIEIKNLGISQNYRNCGIGSWCLQEIEAIYPAKCILVGTGDGSLGALKFYKKNGFIQHAIRKNFFLNNYDHPIIENGIQLKDQIILRKK